MLYPVYIHMGDASHAHGVTFPDFAGCYSAADSWERLPAAIQEASEAHFAGEEGPIPPPTALEELVLNPVYQGESGCLPRSISPAFNRGRCG